MQLFTCENMVVTSTRDSQHGTKHPLTLQLFLERAPNHGAHTNQELLYETNALKELQLGFLTTHAPGETLQH
jgi:hypothetical protein